SAWRRTAGCRAATPGRTAREPERHRRHLHDLIPLQRVPPRRARSRRPRRHRNLLPHLTRKSPPPRPRHHRPHPVQCPQPWPTTILRTPERLMAATATATAAATKNREDWAFEELRDESEDLRKRLNRFRTSLGRFFVEKQELIDLMVVAA